MWFCCDLQIFHKHPPFATPPPNLEQHLSSEPSPTLSLSVLCSILGFFTSIPPGSMSRWGELCLISSDGLSVLEGEEFCLEVQERETLGGEKEGLP